MPNDTKKPSKIYMGYKLDTKRTFLTKLGYCGNKKTPDQNKIGVNDTKTSK